MSSQLDLVFHELASLTREMGKGGGLVSPSVYDTAQVLRHCPPAEGSEAAVEWILSRQHADGGWGDPSVPLGRDMPTLAAVLLLHSLERADDERAAALDFLRAQADQWHEPLPMDIPIGVELIVPRLLEEAREAGLDLPAAPYAALLALGEKRHAMMAKFTPSAGTSAVHSWEAWGKEPDPALVDGAGSLGHSPSATAAWLGKAAGSPALEAHAARVRKYLKAAEAATGTGIPGVVPTVYPIARFEELWLPYGLLIADLLDEPRLSEALAPIIEGIEEGLKRGGLGFSDYFDPDGDDTAAGLAVLLKASRPVDLACLERFESGEHFCTWRHEMAPSLSTTARAIHVLSLAGQAVEAHQNFLLRHQAGDGRWIPDKWNESWLYITLHAVAALAASPKQGHVHAVGTAVQAVLHSQQPDGGWGFSGQSTATETAYGVLTLYAAANGAAQSSAIEAAMDRAHAYLRAAYRADSWGGPACWIGKETYRPYRVDRAFELIALAVLGVREEARAAS